MSEWVLVPVEPPEVMASAAEVECKRMDGVIDPVIHVWDAMLDARPPIPRAVWNAMVERGLTATVPLRFHADSAEMHSYMRNRERKLMEAALRAALGNPRVEGDAP